VEALQEPGIRLIQALQAASPALDRPMRLLSFLGETELYLLVLPLIYWCIDRRLGLRALLILILVDALGNVLKLLLHEPRPYWLGAVKALSRETTYGIPSSHASDSLAVWGCVAHRSGRLGFLIGAAVLSLLIGLSRLYLGVHFPHDVVVGWLLGLAVLWAFLRSEGRVARWAARQGASALLAVGLAASVAVVVTGAVLQALLAGVPDPEFWAPHAIRARGLAPWFSSAGALFGAVAGGVLVEPHAPFRPARSVGGLAACYLLGIAGVVLLFFGLDRAFGLIAPDETLAGQALRGVRYTAVTLWVLFLAPWIFLRVGLLEPESAAA
jgi:membrane-associated phospholipid phosphatase